MKKILKNESKGITLVALVVTIVVLLILAAVSIQMLSGENGIITQAQSAKDETEQANVEEKVKVAIGSLIGQNLGDTSKITPEMIAEEINKEYNRTDVKAEGNTFPTNIKFEQEGRKVGVELNLAVTRPKEEKMYNEEGLETKIASNDLFLYEVISDAEVGAINMDNLPTKKARITGMNPEFCNSITNDTNYEDTNYEIIYNGEKISDTLVVPYQVEIDGEMYRITEVNLFAEGGSGYSFPKVETVIYPNTVEKISGKTISSGVYYNNKLKKAVLPQNLTSIGDYAFEWCNNLTSINIPESVTSIGAHAFYECSSLTSINIPESVTSIGAYAFRGCSSLTSINIKKVTDSITGAPWGAPSATVNWLGE